MTDKKVVGHWAISSRLIEGLNSESPPTPDSCQICNEAVDDEKEDIIVIERASRKWINSETLEIINGRVPVLIFHRRCLEKKYGILIQEAEMQDITEVMQ